MRKRWIGRLAALMLAGFGVPGSAAAQSWGGTEANERAIMSLYDEAVAAGETQVVAYGPFSISFKPIWDIFTKRFPKLSIVGNPISAAQLLAKINAEVTSGQRVGDVMMSGTTDILLAADQGRTEPYIPPNAKDALAPEYIDPDGRYLFTYAGLVGISYNVDRVDQKDLPRSLKDLLDPKYKGMVVDDPLSGALTTLSWTELLRAGKIDGAWIKAIKPNLIVVPSTTPYVANLSTGSVAMMPFSSFNRYIWQKAGGGRIGFIRTPGLSVPTINGMAMIKDPPHPKAARLFLAWIITPEAQNALAPLGGAYPLARGATVPADWPVFKDMVAAVPPTPPADYAKARATLEKTVREYFR